jgi:hypothetical protein
MRKVFAAGITPMLHKLHNKLHLQLGPRCNCLVRLSAKLQTCALLQLPRLAQTYCVQQQQQLLLLLPSLRYLIFMQRLLLL